MTGKDDNQGFGLNISADLFGADEEKSEDKKKKEPAKQGKIPPNLDPAPKDRTELPPNTPGKIDDAYSGIGLDFLDQPGLKTEQASNMAKENPVENDGIVEKANDDTYDFAGFSPMEQHSKPAPSPEDEFKVSFDRPPEDRTDFSLAPEVKAEEKVLFDLPVENRDDELLSITGSQPQFLQNIEESSEQSQTDQHIDELADVKSRVASPSTMATPDKMTRAEQPEPSEIKETVPARLFRTTKKKPKAAEPKQPKQQDSMKEKTEQSFVLHLDEDDDELDPSFIREIAGKGVAGDLSSDSDMELKSLKWKGRIVYSEKKKTDENLSLIILADNGKPKEPAKNQPANSINRFIDEALDSQKPDQAASRSPEKSAESLSKVTRQMMERVDYEADAHDPDRKYQPTPDREEGTEKISALEIEARTRKGAANASRITIPIEKPVQGKTRPTESFKVSPPANHLGFNNDPSSNTDFQETQVFNVQAGAYLEKIDGDLTWSRHNILKEKNIIGRVSSSDIVIAHTSCSRKHAAIVLTKGRYFLVDLESTNGIFVNNRKVRKWKLGSGDELKIGDFLFRFIRETDDGTDGSTKISADLLPLIDDEEKTVAQGMLPPVVEVASHRQNPSVGDLFTKQPIALPSDGRAGHGQVGKKALLTPRTRIILLALMVLVFIVLIYQTIRDATKQLQATITNTVDQFGNQQLTSLTGEMGSRFIIYYNSGLDKFEVDNYIAAADEFEKALKLDPQNELVNDYWERAKAGIRITSEIKEQMGKVKDELRIKEEIRNLIERAQDLYNQEKMLETLELWQRILELDPTNPDARGWIERLQQEISLGPVLQQKREAEKVFRDVYPNARTFAENGDYQKAVELASSLRDNAYAQENNLVQNIERDIEDWKGRIDEVVKRDCDQAEVYWAGGDKVQARKLLKEALDKFPSHERAKKLYGQYREELRNKAINLYREGRIKYELIQDFDAAKQDFQEAIKLLEEDDEYYQKVKDLLSRVQ